MGAIIAGFEGDKKGELGVRQAAGSIRHTTHTPALSLEKEESTTFLAVSRVIRGGSDHGAGRA